MIICYSYPVRKNLDTRYLSRRGRNNSKNLLLPWTTESNISQDDQYVWFEMRAQRKVHQIPLNDEFDVGFEVEGYAYNDLIPSPVLIAKKGQTLKVDFFNDLDAPTTIHWHGIKSPENMDGVPYAHEPVGPEEFFNIEIPLEQEGTFWFHPHYDTAKQVDMGLYGMLIVEDQEHPIAKYPKRFLLLMIGNLLRYQLMLNILTYMKMAVGL